jgi:hypothetical protein
MSCLAAHTQQNLKLVFSLLGDFPAHCRLKALQLHPTCLHYLRDLWNRDPHNKVYTVLSYYAYVIGC